MIKNVSPIIVVIQASTSKISGPFQVNKTIRDRNGNELTILRSWLDRIEHQGQYRALFYSAHVLIAPTNGNCFMHGNISVSTNIPQIELKMHSIAYP